MQKEENNGQIAAAEEESLSRPIQELAGRLRLSRRLMRGILLAAAAFFPFALEGLNGGDLGTSGFMIWEASFCSV
jgi:hypothetical protein